LGRYFISYARFSLTLLLKLKRKATLRALISLSTEESA